MDKLESVQLNEIYKMFRDFDIQTYYLILDR